MADRAFLDGPEVLAEFTASTSGAQLPAAASPIDSLLRPASGTAGAASSQVLTTVQGEGIQIYSTADSKCLRSWTFPPGVRFACPAKYRARYTDAGEIGDSFVYVALDAGDGIADGDRGAVVWRWTDRGIGSIGLEDRLDATLDSPVLALEPGATAAGHMLVVHRDGSATLTSEALKTVCRRAAPVCSGTSEAIWYQLVDVSHSMRSYLDSRQVTDWLGGDVSLALVLARGVEQDGAHAYHVSLLAVDGGEASVVEIGTTRINPVLLDAQPLACAFDADTGTMAMLTEAGTYVHFSLSTGSSALDDAIVLERTKAVVLRGFVPCAGSATPGGVLVPSLLTQSRLTMAALTEKYVAIAGTHSVVSHASKGPYESVLTIWDLQYGCLHAEQPLELPASWLQGASKGQPLPRLTYQIQPLGARLSAGGAASEQLALAVTVAHTADAHASLDGDAGAASTRARKRGKRAPEAGVSWGVKTFVASAFLPQLTLLASLRLQNNPRYFVDPEEQASRARNVHPSNVLLHEEQEQGLGVLRSGWEAVVDGTAAKKAGVDTVEAFLQISKKREDAQSEENEVLLALANVSDTIDSNQYTKLFMEHIGVTAAPDAPAGDRGDTWISAHLMTTVMRRCFAEPLGVSRSARLPLFAPRVVEFMLTSCGLCNAHAPAPGLLKHLLARVDAKGRAVLAGHPAWELVCTALRRCPDLPESQVVDVLRFQLGHYEAHVDKLFCLSRPADECAGDATREIAADIMRTVSAIASTAGSDDMLRLALADMPLNHVACVIRLLIIWMRGWAAMGASVEMAASAGFAQAASTALAQQDTADADGAGRPAASPVTEAIACASSSRVAPVHNAAPAIDASLTIFKAPREPPRTDGAGASIVRVFTRKWAPALSLSDELIGAPELGSVVDLATLMVDAHLSSILLSAEFSRLVAQLTEASDMALQISDQLKLLRIGLAPFHAAWEKQQERRVADDRAQQMQALGLDEVVLLNGTTRSQAERQSDAAPNARCAQGTGPAGTYWERIQKLEKYRVEVMHW
ncbi:hypothetical protein LPJ61_000459 [Coemansia biformis]|uniref:Uncharacterized protein n=1 Tax=Coemansia biformis TaxID=1286918 RepID=A0A9W8CY58_9FUNG|nr:hypothetical protein LPJ61_000459 [Coemansia biformis]